MDEHHKNEPTEDEELNVLYFDKTNTSKKNSIIY